MRYGVICLLLPLIVSGWIHVALYRGSTQLIIPDGSSTVLIRREDTAAFIGTPSSAWGIEEMSGLLSTYGPQRVDLVLSSSVNPAHMALITAAVQQTQPQIAAFMSDQVALLPYLPDTVRSVPSEEVEIALFGDVRITNASQCTLIEAGGIRILKLHTGYGIIDRELTQNLDVIISPQGQVHNISGRVSQITADGYVSITIPPSGIEA